MDSSALAYFTSVSYNHKKSITLAPLDVAFNEKTKDRSSWKEKKEKRKKVISTLTWWASPIKLFRVEIYGPGNSIAIILFIERAWVR